MIQNVYSVRDRLDGFGRPFTCPSDAFAKRDFAAAVQSKDGSSSLAFCPADFDLYVLGVFDSESGVITPTTPPRFVAKGADFVEN